MLSVSLGQWALLCLLAGLVTSLLLNIPMSVQPEGYLPAYVAASGLIDVDPSEVSDALAVGIHHVVGMIAALLYGAVVVVLSLMPTVGTLGDVPILPHLVGILGVTLFIYFFFARVAFPRACGSLQMQEHEIVGQWALSTFIYGVTLGLLVPVLSTIM